MNTISDTPQTSERPAGVPANWEPAYDTDGTVLDWVGHKSTRPQLRTEAVISVSDDPTLTPGSYLELPQRDRLMSAAELHQLAGQFFEFYRDVCTHLPGVEVPQQRLADTVETGREV